MKKLILGIIILAAAIILGVSLFVRPAGAIETPAPAIFETDYSFVTFDNGKQGNKWAIDTFHSHLKFTRLEWGVWKIERTDTGTFEVLPGAKSPGGVEGTLVGDGTKGTISGAITVIIHGYAKNDVPANSGTDDLREAGGDYYHKYFGKFFNSISSGTTESWGWTYKTCNNGTWVDTAESEESYPDGDIMGDIKGPYVACAVPVEPEPVKVENPLTAAGAPICGGVAPSPIPNALAKRVNSTNALVVYWPTTVGGQVNIRYREEGSSVWQHALRDYPNLGVAPIGFLKANVNYEYQLTNGNGCAQSLWSKVFKGL